MKYKDYYQIMGVSRSAGQEEIKRAYRKLARKYHPDVSKEADAEAKFKELGEAYEVLKDSEKKAAYDQLGTQWRADQEFNPPPNWQQKHEFKRGQFHEADFTDYSDFFEQLFGGKFGFHAATSGSRQQFHTHGPDAHSKLKINLEDSYTGAARTIILNIPAIDATGQIETLQKSLNVKIPKGIKPGQHIRLTGQGNPGVGDGQFGDLLLEIAFNNHAVFQVSGADVYLNLPVAPWEAALGAKIKAPTPSGTINIKIPANSQQGTKLRLAGRGIPAKTPGDFYIILQVTLPPAITEKAKAAYQHLQQELDFNPRDSLGAQPK